jgi:hypothetical protein
MESVKNNTASVAAFIVYRKPLKNVGKFGLIRASQFKQLEVFDTSHKCAR